ncbi:MAG: metallopeptidase family protein [Phycisphaeraceae bacterium]|nr:MAG: metallopeptidase family protein [Phycisphaeraceae bacterium]
MREIPVILDDRPSPKLLKELGMGSGELLCGLHSGIALTDRSIEHSGVLPDEIRLFREGIVETAGGWEAQYAEDEIYEQIRITLLHEIGHHFGLDEDDLAELGYD